MARSSTARKTESRDVRPDPATDHLRWYEVDLAEFDGIRVGDRARTTLEADAAMGAHGNGDIFRQARRTGGTVVRIVQQNEGAWTMILVRLDAPAVYLDGSGGDPYAWISPDEIEVIR